jgi:cobalt-precorrin 5A hydrolase
MEDRKAVAGMIAIGVGCRKICDSAAIVALVRRALRDCASLDGARRLFTLEDKAGDPAVRAAAAELGFELQGLSREALAAAAPRLRTRSAAAQRRFGLASIAEAAALAGGGPNARLLAPRLAADGATCAVAIDFDSSADVSR